MNLLLQFSTAHIVDDDYPGIMRLEKMLFDVYLCTAYRCRNMELGPIMGGKYKCEKNKKVSLLPLPSSFLSSCHLVIFISKSGNLTDVYDANHRL